MKLALDIIPL